MLKYLLKYQYLSCNRDIKLGAPFKDDQKKQQDDKIGNKKRTWKICSIKKKKRCFGKYCYIQPVNIAISIRMLFEF